MRARTLLLWPGVGLGLAALALCEGGGDVAEAALATITTDDLSAHVALLAGPALEGRDTPSRGLELAARYLERRFAELGLEPLGDEGFRQGFAVQTRVPVEESCCLEVSLADGSMQAFVLGRDYVPVAGCEGEASGELVFLGFAIDDSKERFEEVPGRLDGKIALVIEGEPRHKRRFDGEEVTEHASLWSKVKDLRDAGVAGVVVVRRATPPLEGAAAELAGDDEPDVSFRHDWTFWQGSATTRPPSGHLPPVLEVDAACGAALLGADVEELARGSDRSGRPPRHKISARDARSVRLSGATRESDVRVANVVGLLRGSDPELAREHVVVGAHYDHVGVGARGRIAAGADDNASGTAALLEIAQACATAPPRRSLIFCAFAGEEKGLLGSRAFCEHPPVSLADVVAMVNLDMIGRGDDTEAAVLGPERNPDLDRVVERARKEARTGVRKLLVGKGLEVWERSDHFSFHQHGVPSLFFFEGVPIDANPDYHTWRDTPERLDIGKVANTTRLAFQTAWILGNDDERPARPRE